MKIKSTLILIISLFLIGSWFIFHFSKDSRSAYQPLIRQFSYGKSTIQVINDATENQVISVLKGTQKIPSQKLIAEMMKEISTILNQFSNEISRLDDVFYQLTEQDFPSGKRYFFPVNYNKKHPVKAVIKAIQNDSTIQLNSKKVLTNLEKVIFQKNENLDLSQAVLNNYYQKQRDLLKNTQVFPLLENKKKWLVDLQKQDVVYARSFLVALRCELSYLKWELLNNAGDLIGKNQKRYKKAYTIEMQADKQPIVNQPFTMAFSMTEYIEAKELTVMLNGKKMTTKDGIVRFDYTPKTAGMKYFHLKSSLLNPFTGKIRHFKKIESIYAN